VSSGAQHLGNESRAGVHLTVLLGLCLGAFGCGPSTDDDASAGSGLRLLTPAPSVRLVVATLRGRDRPLTEDPDALLFTQLLQWLLDGEEEEIEIYPADQSALLELQGAGQTEALHALTGSELVLTGTVHRGEESLAVEVELSREGDGSREPVSLDGPVGDPLRLVERVAAEVQNRLGDVAGPSGSSMPDRSARPESAWIPRQADPLAALAAGRQRLWLSDAAGAAELLGRAATAAPHSVLVRLELSRALHSLGSLSRARAEARRAIELAGEGAGDGALELRALAALLDGSPRAAAEIQRRRVAARPWSAAPRFALVHALLEAGDGRAAFAAIAELRSLPLGTNDRLRIELLAARAAKSLDDPSGWMLLAETARDRAEAAGLPLVEAQAWLSMAEARLALGRPSGARTAAQSARRLFLSLSHRRHAAMARAIGAIAALGDGAVGEARTDLEGAADELRRERDAGNVASVLYNLGVLELQQGELTAAETRLRESLALRRGLAESVGAAECLSRLAEVELRRGRETDAHDLHGEALALLEEDGVSPQEGELVLELAVRLAPGERADLDAARRLVLQAAVDAGDRTLEARARSDLGESLLTGAELRVARDQLERALTLFAELGDRPGADRCRLLLANVAAEERRFGEASTLAEQVVGGAVERGDSDLEAIARAIVAWSHLELGHPRAAADHMARAREAAAHTHDPATRLAVDLAAARTLAASGDVAAARKELLRVLDEAGEQGLEQASLEAELALAEIELLGDEVETGRRRLERVVARAQSAGWALLAERARRARSESPTPAAPRER
jgi:tetratricopeptide (TPR) repeat protein